MSNLPVPKTSLPAPIPTGLTFPVTQLDEIIFACDPGTPLSLHDERYTDFIALRQGVSVKQFENVLKVYQKASHTSRLFCHTCLSGHRGSGKSTELLALKDWAESNGFLAIRTEVDAEYGSVALETTDLFLLAARATDEELRNHGFSIPEENLKNITAWFAEVVQEAANNTQSELNLEAGAQLGGALPLSLGNLFAKFTSGLKSSSTHAVRTRENIRNYPDRLCDLTNELLTQANVLIGKKYPNGLLLLFDNLDRYEPEVIDKFLMRGRTLVDRLACHAVFTLPIGLEADPSSPAVQDNYGYPVVLPMLGLRRKSATWKGTVADSDFEANALATMRGALGKRMNIAELFQEPKDADLLITMCGGCLRDLMHLVTQAFIFREDEATQISTNAVTKAIHRMRATYLRRLNSDHYARLAYIARKKEMRPETDAKAAWEQKNQLLFHRYALEYLDENDLPWIDVHPIIVDTEDFQNAYKNTATISRV